MDPEQQRGTDPTVSIISNSKIRCSLINHACYPLSSSPFYSNRRSEFKLLAPLTTSVRATLTPSTAAILLLNFQWVEILAFDLQRTGGHAIGREKTIAIRPPSRPSSHLLIFFFSLNNVARYLSALSTLLYSMAPMPDVELENLARKHLSLPQVDASLILPYYWTEVGNSARERSLLARILRN